MLTSLVASLGTVLISPILESLTTPLGVSGAEAGLILTAYIAPSIVGIPSAGLLADRYGRKPVLIVGLILFGLGGASIAFTDDFSIVLALRAVQGVGYAGTLPVVVASIGDIYEGTTESTAQGLRFTSSGLAQATFPLLAGLLVTLSWRFPFLLYTMAFVVAIFVLVWFEEPTSATIRERDTRPQGTYLRCLSRLVVTPHVMATVIALAVPSFLFLGFVTYNSFLVVRVLGETPAKAGALITVNSLVYATVASQSGRLAGLFKTKVPPILGGEIALSLGLGVFAVAPSYPVAIVGVFLMGTGHGILFTMLRSVITEFATEDLRGGLVGIGETVVRIGNGLAPVFIGVAIAFLQSGMGFDGAVRTTLLGVAVGGCLVGVPAVVALHRTGSLD